MFPLIGSGRFVTAPIITEDGKAIQDPIVLLQTNPHGAVLTPQNNSHSSTGIATNVTAPTSMDTEFSFVETVQEPSIHVLLDKNEIQWKLTLHQIG